MKKRHETNEKERNKRKIPFFRLFRSFSFVSCSLFVITFSILLISAQSDARQKREQLYRLNNLGVALLEQFKHEEAAKQFKQALAADPDFALARINLALALYFLNDSRSAAEEAKTAVKLAPESPQAHYVLGIALRNEKLYDESIAEFNKVLAIDRKDPATNVNIGQIYSQKQQHSQAIPFFRNALDAEPFNATAVYSLGQALIRTGNTSDGKIMLDRFQQLRASGYATTLGNVYGEKGRYAEAVISSGAEPELVSAESKNAGFVGAPAGLAVKTNTKQLTSFTGSKINKSEFNETKKRELIAAFSSNLGIGDFDNDHRPDLFFSGIDNDGKPFVRLLRNDGGKFSDVTDKSKISAGQPVSGAVFGDFDNDGKNDIAVFGYQTLSLWRNNGDGSFTDATAKAGALANYPSWAMTAAWVDLDHDGDLDLFTGNFADLRQWPSDNETAVFPDDFPGEENKLFRNNGDGTFTDLTARTGLGGGRNKTTAVVCTDFNNQRDIDFLVINYGAPVQLFSNQRDGSFKETAEQAGIKYSGKSFAVAAGDYNKDGFPDFGITGLNINGESAIFTSDGRGGFKLSRLATGTNSEQLSNTLGAQFLDYDNDGLLDIALQSGQKLAIRRNLGDRFVNSEGLPSELNLAEGRTFVSGDLFGTGRTDIAAIKDDGTPIILKN
ncbi:MAG: FG-GAP-like repeat-containing protein, partial [Acidobacteria bacterium]|nr:FG-GAP-like repeat-containing protein [Acidobacteriota bacterium]